MKARLRSNGDTRLLPNTARTDPLYRTSLMPIDRSGNVKMDTLESIFLVQQVKGWCTVNELHRDLEDMAASPFESGRRGVSMRMLRYRRDGLLIRVKIGGRLTEYKLSERGEDRLIHFWRKFGLLTPPPEWQLMGEKGRIAKELADLRMSLFHYLMSVCLYPTHSRYWHQVLTHYLLLICGKLTVYPLYLGH